MSARDRILARLRAAPQWPPAEPPDVSEWFMARRRSEDSAQRIARLRGALEAAHAEVHDATAEDWPELLLRIAAAKALRTLLIGDGTAHGDLLEARHPDTLRLLRYAESVESFRDTLFDGVDAGLTLAKGAIAETGSLILWPDSHEPRLMSLVPPLHFVLLDAATIHADFHAALCAENWRDGLPTNALLISGPSKTADIQQTLAYGAHGPRELIVLLLHAQGAAP
jgi:L-lactate dehydrogenase complex protein LldG